MIVQTNLLFFTQRVFFHREIIQQHFDKSTMYQKYQVGPYGGGPGVSSWTWLSNDLGWSHGFLFLLCTSVISHLLAALFQFRGPRQQLGLPIPFAKPRARPSRPHRPSGRNGPANERDDSHRQPRSYHPETTRDVVGRIPRRNMSSRETAGRRREAVTTHDTKPSMDPRLSRKIDGSVAF